MSERENTIRMALFGRLNRRQLLQRGALLGVTTPVVSGLLTACGGDDNETESTDTGNTPATTGGSPEATEANTAATSTVQGTTAGGEAADVQEGGTLRFGAWQTPDTMDPQKTGLAATSRILFQVLQPLVWKFPDSDEFYPGLAEEWEISDDGLEYTFTLRQEIKFHNDEPFNADSVVWTYERMADEAQQTLARLPNFDHAEKLDDYKAKVVFGKPYGPFLPLLSASVAYMPIPPAQSKDNPDEFGLTPAGTGPFIISEYVHKSHATLKRNPDYNWAPEGYYHRNGPAKLERIEWKIIEEPATRVATLQSDEIDMAEDVAAALVQQIEADSRFQMIYHDTLGCPRTVCLNCEKFPTDDRAVRQAMSYAVNKQTITDVVFKKTREPRYGPIEPLTPAYNPEVEKYYHFDPEQAKQILEEAGWTDSDGDGIREKDGQPLKALFIVVANDKFDEPAQVIQSNFKDVGIDLEITTESEPTVFNTYNRGDQNLANIFWWGTDPSSLYSLYHSSNIEQGFNWSHYRNADVDRLLEEGQVLTDIEKRRPSYEQAQILIMEDAASIPIWGKRVTIGAKKEVAGMAWSQNVYPIFYNAGFSG